ncbi:hypothetical protein C2G38_2136978 [Gigaspora rosea]|uniref:Reelin domain-containing protein n=1 Tax=Gigaspora rosea TaxID=44941 RepID=A0A397W350_9GLOM|nr:hypothetical protein C2G38_2136978 [Gigaspora rosea]
MRLKIWKLFFVVACVIILGTQDVISMVDDICTSTGVDSISSLTNTINEGISIEILDFNETGYVIFKVDVANEQNITNIVLWGETIIAQSEQHVEQHVGTFAPIVDHAYVYGCNGYPESTITNFDKPVNNNRKEWSLDCKIGIVMKKKGFYETNVPN